MGQRVYTFRLRYYFKYDPRSVRSPYRVAIDAPDLRTAIAQLKSWEPDATIIVG